MEQKPCTLIIVRHIRTIRYFVNFVLLPLNKKGICYFYLILLPIFRHITNNLLLCKVEIFGIRNK